MYYLRPCVEGQEHLTYIQSYADVTAHIILPLRLWELDVYSRVSKEYS